MKSPIPGTVIVYGPHYTREGFGQLARTWALALHSAGLNVKIVPVNCQDRKMTGGLDDLDWPLLRSLEHTPISGPVTAIFAYVPIYLWPKLPLPEPHLRIMLTTYDSGVKTALPQPRLVFICNQMDQVWVVNPAEEQAWIRAGLEPHRIRSFKSPHLWLGSKLLPPPKAKESRGEPFRFLNVSLFLPRRRMDVLLRAFFEEFQTSSEAELYLKMTYPSWHPQGPGKAKSDLADLIENSRRQTGSHARVIVDEELGTRLGMVSLLDSSDVYVSPDLVSTAPVGEALIRKRPVIIAEGWGIDLPPQVWAVPNTTEQIQVTPEMAEYMPHLRGTSFPGLDLGRMRQALRHFHDLSDTERQTQAEAAHVWLDERYSFAATIPSAITAIEQGWKNKKAAAIELRTPIPLGESEPKPAGREPYNIHWCGLQLFHGRFGTVAREICLELIRRGHKLSLTPGNGPFHVEELDLNQSPKFPELAARFHDPLPGPADFNVCSRMLPSFNEQPANRQILINTWWTSALPVNWVKPVREQVQEVWVPSRFVRDNLIQAGVAAEQVQVIPFGFDPAVFRPKASPARLQTKKRFKFLFVGEASKRKGFDRVLLAYLKVFTSRDDVCLVVKDMNCEDYYARRAGEEMVRQCQANPHCPEIEYLDAMMGEEELAGLYTACDCFLQPFRSAGFGLAILEAMACGLPVITTGYGGPLDFCDEQTAFLLPAREIRHHSQFAGQWRIDGDLLHGRIQARDLEDRMNHLYRNPERGIQRANLARERVHAEFTWARTVDRIVGRFQALEQTPLPGRRGPAQPSWVAPDAQVAGKSSTEVPTLVVIAPFYNRSGYGVAARSLVLALHASGCRVRTVPVDNVEEGIDDCDMEWLKSLEQTPVTLPVVAIFFHVPSPQWLKVELPPQSIRILFTTFDSSAQGNLPPAEWVGICKQMDQVWLMTENEAAVFATAGVPRSNIHVLKTPHPWVNNPALPPAKTAPGAEGKRFRFLCVSMFLPRRRWDTLIEAFLTEFKDSSDVELCLKVNYPSWHPVPGQPQRDLRLLIERLRASTGSKAEIILDESLDTRLGICRLIDSCDVYVSTDTSITAPVGEAFVRHKIAIIPEGYGVTLPYGESTLIPVDPKLTQPMTEEMLAYQPHHRGRQMPLLRVADVRQSLRVAYELPENERLRMGHLASLMMECEYGSSVVTPHFLKAIDAGLRQKFSPPKPDNGKPLASGPVMVDWIGSFLDFGSLSHVNRELTRALADSEDVRLHCVNSTGVLNGSVIPEALKELASGLFGRPSIDSQITVRHAWPPDWKRPQSGKLVVIQPWEFGALPQLWVAQAKNVDEFWVPSEYVRRVYVESGVPGEKVTVVPNGIDPERFHPNVPPMKLATQKKFKFLFVGGTIFRKGPDLLLKAFLDNFTAADDVCLVIKDFGGKSVYAGQTFESQIRAAQSQPNAPEILYLNEELPPESLPGLYAACDTFVLPYRGEGFGLPVLEAMACGLPVIVTAGGATDDFVRDEFAWRISAGRLNFGGEVSGLKLVSPGWLLNPDLAALGRFLREAFANPAETRKRGQLAAEHARRSCSWENSGAIAAQRLRELGRIGPSAVRDRGSKLTAGKTPLPAVAKITLPPCALVGQLAEPRELIRQKNLSAAWQSALFAIAQRPFHPEAWLLLAEIANTAGDGQSAKLCAEHVRHLAPNWKSARKFLNQRLKGGARPKWLKLPDEKSKAPRLTVCLITKNEEQFLERCLQSVRELAHQIVVLDTGSTDRTVEIAKKFNAEVHHFAWCEDFSAARNEALKHATGDWVLSLDADEELLPEHRQSIIQEMQAAEVMAYRLPIIDVGREADGCSYVPRLFRNAPGLFFIGRVHEQIFSSVEVRSREWGLENRLGKATLLHHGYTKEVVASRGKGARNLRLLQLAMEELPGEPNLVMNLGLELVRSGQLEAGLEQYGEAFELMAALPPRQVVPELRETLLTQFASHLLKARRFTEIISLWQHPFAQSAGVTASQHFLRGLAHLELKQAAEAAEEMRQCLAKRGQPALSPINQEILQAGPQHCLALALATLGDTAAAERAFRAALADDPASRTARFDFAKFHAQRGQPVEALKLLNSLTEEQPDDLPVWQFGGHLALSQPEFLEFAQNWTTEALRHFPKHPAILALHAETLLLGGQAEAALPFWLEGHSPGSARHLAALTICEVLADECRRTFPPADEKLVSQEFLKWYRQFIKYGANLLVSRLNEKLDSLRAPVPTAVDILQTAMKQVTQAVAA